MPHRQFDCAEYENFSKTYAFQHTTSSPYHPAGNGRAEAAVKLVKTMMKKSKDLHIAMLHYRNTPPKGHTYSPAQRMLQRRTKITLPTTAAALIPQLVSYSSVIQDIRAKRFASKQLYDKHAGIEHTQLDVGSYAYASHLPTEEAVHGAIWCRYKRRQTAVIHTSHSIGDNTSKQSRSTASCRTTIRFGHTDTISCANTTVRSSGARYFTRPSTTEHVRGHSD